MLWIESDKVEGTRLTIVAYKETQSITFSSTFQTYPFVTISADMRLKLEHFKLVFTCSQQHS